MNISIIALKEVAKKSSYFKLIRETHRCFELEYQVTHLLNLSVPHWVHVADIETSKGVVTITIEVSFDLPPQWDVFELIYINQKRGV